NADQDSQDLQAARPLGHRRVKAITTLFDGRHMKSRSVGNGLDVSVRGEIGVRSGDGWKLPRGQGRNRLRKRKIAIQIRVIRGAAVPGPPTRIQGELHEICESWNATGSGGLAAGQSAELIEVGRAAPCDIR